MTTLEMLKKAKAVCPEMAFLTTQQKNKALNNIADAIIASADEILAANALDMAEAVGTMSEVMLDRLELNMSRLEGMAKGVREVAELPDPTGRVIRRTERPGGLVIDKVAVPMGVVSIIYESRPNVTSDAAALCLKSGNVCVLRSGKAAFRSANAITEAMRRGVKAAGLPEESINLVQDTSHESANELMRAVGLVDLLIPRGGAGLIRNVTENAKVPCIKTGTGICHIYVDKDADLNMALNIIENAKTSRPSVCNAEEVCLVHEAIAEKFLPMLRQKLTGEQILKGGHPVETRLDSAAAAIIDGVPAGEKDFDTEFLDYILAIKIVSDVKEAVRHIALHSTGHSDGIVTNNKEAADYFAAAVDSAAVYINASTRFTDGGEFGLGCEMGISTQKLHARGPMGLEELCTYKYVVRGNGNVR
ncbi:MAG: glutamate-5-semialdehyde dehydrogenase [Oscillospiraceae bacterium]|nr:glutamate-5-semialdehyde dehydrogenase [Oscillospiraceae bacterium]